MPQKRNANPSKNASLNHKNTRDPVPSPIVKLWAAILLSGNWKSEFESGIQSPATANYKHAVSELAPHDQRILLSF